MPKKSVKPGTRQALIALLCCYCGIIAGPATAAGVPSHLASMAKQLLTQRADELRQKSGDKGQDAIYQRAQEIINQAGVRYWAQSDIYQQGASEQLASAMGLDLSDTKQWAELHQLLQIPSREKQLEAMRSLLRRQGRPGGGAEFQEMLGQFDQVRTKLAENMAKRHVIDVGDHGESLMLAWDPVRGRFDVQVKGISPKDGDGFDLRMGGDVATVTDPSSNDIRLEVKPDDQPVNVLTDAEIAEHADTLFGRWREPEGSGHPGTVWELIAASGGQAKNDSSRQNARARIEQLQQEIDRIRNNKVFRWKNPKSGKLLNQKKFKRMPEPWEYEGQFASLKNAEQVIQQHERKIAELKTKGAELPAEIHDPVRMKAMLTAQAGNRNLTINVTNAKGYIYRYDLARIAAGRITARRTLRKQADITNLPQKVTNQLLASWNPPEWIELDLQIDRNDQQVYLEGLLWRLHVTYSGMDYTVDSIHTPYSRPLKLVRGEVSSAEGASQDASL